jgi:hypothetical protein
MKYLQDNSYKIMKVYALGNNISSRTRMRLENRTGYVVYNQLANKLFRGDMHTIYYRVHSLLSNL